MVAYSAIEAKAKIGTNPMITSDISQEYTNAMTREMSSPNTVSINVPRRDPVAYIEN